MASAAHSTIRCASLGETQCAAASNGSREEATPAPAGDPLCMEAGIVLFKRLIE